ncbi:MAG: hypothetical protein AAF629_00910 [Chloroflexota bacterium]
MHTSTRLNNTDFKYWHQRQGQMVETTFDHFCPNYYPLDRLGVVSPHLEDGVLETGSGLLAVTTAFYDTQRAHTTDFFAYPQHFALVGQHKECIQTYQGFRASTQAGLWDSWSWLDVWPEAKWTTAPATASAMLKQAFDHQINRLFWPYSLRPNQNEGRLPNYAFKMLQTDLKMVVYYNLPSTRPASSKISLVGVQANETAYEIVQESMLRLPTVPNQENPRPNTIEAAPIEWYQPVAIDDFLQTMRPCFDV